MNSFSITGSKIKTTFLALLILLSSPIQSAHAFHIGAFLGPSFFSSNGQSDQYMSGGFDAAMSFTPALEIGGYYFRTLSSYQTMVGAELNFFPLISHFFYFGGKLGNANLANDNHIVYAPTVGFNHDISTDLSIGVDGSYFIYNNSSLKDLSLLANIKIWL